MDFKCQNGAEERVFDQVSEAAEEQTHCHTYHSVGFHDNPQQSAHSLKKNNKKKVPETSQTQHTMLKAHSVQIRDVNLLTRC